MLVLVKVEIGCNRPKIFVHSSPKGEIKKTIVSHKYSLTNKKHERVDVSKASG